MAIPNIRDTGRMLVLPKRNPLPVLRESGIRWRLIVIEVVSAPGTTCNARPRATSKMASEPSGVESEAGKTSKRWACDVDSGLDIAPLGSLWCREAPIPEDLP